MQFKQTLVRLFFLLTPFTVFSQATTYLPQDVRENVLMERLEIKAQTDSVFNFSKTKPFRSRYEISNLKKYWERDASKLQNPASVLTEVDYSNLTRAFQNNSEYFSDSIFFKSKKPFLKTFYKSPANFYEVHTKDFFLALNPVIQFVVGKESNNDESIFLNTRGIALRGNIANKIGFAAYAADNQERDPFYVQQFVSDRKAVPGAGFYKNFKGTGYDYFDARGYITLNALKYIDVQFGLY
jgi:hypothetical protein